MSNLIPLTKDQKEIMVEFYKIPETKVVYNKIDRDKLWKKAMKRVPFSDFDQLKTNCPALYHQIRKSYESDKNIQSAVFSECVYAQTFANMLNLNLFVNCYEDSNFIPPHIVNLLSSYHLTPRYVYSDTDKNRMLIQAGGCDGIDSALITVIDLVIYTIEFKEPGAKTSEPDLPKYNEDGVLVVTESWLKKYPHFKAMLDEQKGLNFFKIMGRNINNFSKQSINLAVSNNYANIKKYATVICTEDIKGNLVIIPTNQASLWADITGEIRPAGRNHYKVWTPKALEKFILDKGGIIEGSTVKIEKSILSVRKERGGGGKVSGYKINPLFFVYANDCSDSGRFIQFAISSVQQLNPTIAGKMFFKNLLHSNVKNYYNFK
ncbi:MAG: hypothetical protein IJO74_00260 [Clostridia bacterium]|nr:hypothetical protein [Clostridia bacterium]